MRYLTHIIGIYRDMKGILTYWVRNGADSLKSVKLTLCNEDDLSIDSTSEMRRMRLVRILDESRNQDVRLSHGDLSMILLVSRATVKRDLSHLRELGLVAPNGGGDG